MSVQAAPAPARDAPEPDAAAKSTATGTVAGPTGRALWRRYRVIPLVLLVIVLVAIGLAVAQRRGEGGRLDPRSVEPTGSGALAALLAERGVEVRRVTDAGTVAQGLGDRDAVLVGVPGQLDVDAAAGLGSIEQGTVVLVNPPDEVLDAVGTGIRQVGVARLGTEEPGCDDPAAVAAGATSIGGTTYDIDEGESCYAGDGEGAPLVIGTTRGGARLVVLGSGDPLTNDDLDEDGNAALALNLLGADGSVDELRWLVPSPGAASEDESTVSILPGWVLPAILQLLLVGLLVALWRGRRLGPPVIEPLPVVVRAAEAVEGRARLYRRAQARDRAAESLRSGALARMVPRLGIDSAAGGEPPPAAVVAAVAARSGRPDAVVHATLFGPPPADDAALVALADTLDSIVRDTLDPEGPQQ